MRKRTLVGTSAAALLGIYFMRLGMKLSGELRRYDRIRSMSNEGPTLEETPDLMMQTMVRERETLKDIVAFFKALPKDIARYLKIESM